MSVSINWFEIPVSDLGRAVEFYGTVLGEPLGNMDGPDGPMHVFLGEEGPAGTLTQELSSSGQTGVLVYLGCDNVAEALKRAEQAGGAIVQEQTSIGPFGFIGRFTDTEGNMVALHTGAE